MMRFVRVLERASVGGAIAMLAIALMSSPSVGADSGVRTEGAAIAALEAGPTAKIGEPGRGMPLGFWEINEAGDPEDVRIYPANDDREYCGSGWHVVSFHGFDLVENFPDTQSLFDALESVEMSFELDGVPLETRRTAIKNLGVHVYQFGVGSLLPPGTLTVGTHELHTLSTSSFYETEDFTTEFTVLPC
jgi:hypothetical protein